MSGSACRLRVGNLDFFASGSTRCPRARILDFVSSGSTCCPRALILDIFCVCVHTLPSGSNPGLCLVWVHLLPLGSNPGLFCIWVHTLPLGSNPINRLFYVWVQRYSNTFLKFKFNLKIFGVVTVYVLVRHVNTKFLRALCESLSLIFKIFQMPRLMFQNVFFPLRTKV